MNKNVLQRSLIAGGGVLAGVIASVALVANAQSAPTTSPAVPNVIPQTVSAPEIQVDKPETTNDPADAPTAADQAQVDKPESASDPADNGSEHQGHRPLGGDGIVSSINGTTITIGEESDEGAASYTVDASKATVTDKSGTTVTLSSLKVGDKIFVEGPVSGTSVSATAISLGHPEKGGHDKNEAKD